MTHDDLLEVHLLGGLHVTRPDGTLVRDEQWRTTRSADLVRLLALSGGRPVPVASILDKFWPDAEDDRAKASLRTALTHLRGAMGRESVHRSRLGISLGPAWVDVTTYQQLAGEAGGYARTEQHAALVRVARESEVLYTGDFHAHDDAAPWVRGARDGLIAMRRRLLGDAADSAVQLRWLRDAIDFGEAAVALDPGLERGYRALMRAYAGLGETDRALGAFDRCRANLADVLGADPSPLTTAVHLEILASPALSFLDRPQTEVAALLERLGPAAGAARYDRRRTSHAPGEGPVATVERRRDGDHADPAEPEPQPSHLRAGQDLSEIAETVLAGPVSDGLARRLARESGGDPIAAMRLLRLWSGRGAVVWTPAGLEVVADHANWEETQTSQRAVRELERRMTTAQVELVRAVALLRRPVRAAELAAMHGDLNASLAVRTRAVEMQLHQLTDIGALRSTPQGYEPRNAGLRDATTARMRPSSRMGLSRKLADLGLVPDVPRQP